jgi:hypothetical protein
MDMPIQIPTVVSKKATDTIRSGWAGSAMRNVVPVGLAGGLYGLSTLLNKLVVTPLVSTGEHGERAFHAAG